MGFKCILMPCVGMTGRSANGRAGGPAWLAADATPGAGGGAGATDDDRRAAGSVDALAGRQGTRVAHPTRTRKIRRPPRPSEKVTVFFSRSLVPLLFSSCGPLQFALNIQVDLKG